MKILFIAPRYHTNQLSIVRELQKNNIEVEYAVHYRGATEDYAELDPIVLKKALTFKLKILFDRIRGKKETEEYYGLKYNASIFNLFSVIRKSKSDIVIVRGKGITERKAKFVSSLLRKPTVLYNQEPLYKPKTKSALKRFLKRIYNSFVPKVRYTPVKVSNYDMLKKKDELVVLPHTYFIPFAGENVAEAEKRSYLAKDRVNFLMVGKYREYKTHKVLVDALVGLRSHNSYKLTFVGQCVLPEEIKYFDELVKYVDSKGLSDNVSFVKNVEPSQMKKYYLENDVLILPTLNEAASISVLEAMHHGMSVISTSQNGTASYIDYGESGFIFKTGDSESLREKLSFYLEDFESVPRMGKCALERAKQNSSRQAYYSAFVAMLDEEFPKVAEKIKSNFN